MPNGPPAVTSQAKVDLLATSLASNFNSQPVSNSPDVPAERPVPSSALCTKEFVQTFLQKLPHKAAVGLDGIRAPFLKNLSSA